MKKEMLEAELAKIGIHNAEDLKKAMEKLPPLDLSMMIKKDFEKKGRAS